MTTMDESWRSAISPLPDGWTTDESSTLPTIVGPEGDIRLTFVEVPPGENPSATALSAWQRLDPGFASTVRREFAVPPEGSWEETHQIIYDTPANEARMDLAVVRRLGGRTFVNLVRGSTAGLSRRGAQLTEAIGRWKPAEYMEENLHERRGVAWGEAQSQALREFIVPALETAAIPGAAVAIVQGGRVVYAAGFGTQRAGDDAAVTPSTRFMIGSTTKSLTTLLMARLVDEGKLTWSTRVIDLLPGFALGDPDTTARLELRHTASASTGMPRQDMEFLFKYSGVTPEDRMAEMRTMHPTTGFGETFQYSNFLVAAGGYAAARADTPDGPLEDAYERAMRELVLDPLGMTNTVLRQEDATTGEAASPHAADLDGTVIPIPLHFEQAVYSVAPAGGAWSTVLDLARYLLLELGKGEIDGKRLISEASLVERRKRGVKVNDKTSYGLGLFISNDSGLEIVHHGGNTLGFSSDLFFLPGQDIGVVALTNAFAATLFLMALRRRVLEIAFGAESKADEAIAMAGRLRAEGVESTRKRMTVDPAGLEWVAALLGTYRCEELGGLTLSKRNGGYWAAFDEWESAVGGEVQAGGDRLLCLVSPPWRGALRLLVDADDGALVLDGGQKRYLFRRVLETASGRA